MPRTGENIYERKDGRFEGRYIASRDENGKAKYACVYGKTKQEVRAKLSEAKEKVRREELQGINTLKRAFADCGNLRDIYIPESTVKIAEDAFEGVSGLTIHGKEGSYAEFYAEKHHYAFIPTE